MGIRDVHSSYSGKNDQIKYKVATKVDTPWWLRISLIFALIILFLTLLPPSQKLDHWLRGLGCSRRPYRLGLGKNQIPKNKEIKYLLAKFWLVSRTF